jgi:hypothetical protein
VGESTLGSTDDLFSPYVKMRNLLSPRSVGVIPLDLEDIEDGRDDERFWVAPWFVAML